MCTFRKISIYRGLVGPYAPAAPTTASAPRNAASCTFCWNPGYASCRTFGCADSGCASGYASDCSSGGVSGCSSGNADSGHASGYTSGCADFGGQAAASVAHRIGVAVVRRLRRGADVHALGHTCHAQAKLRGVNQSRR